MERTLDWLLVLEPEASLALRLAAITHDIERAFPPADDSAPSPTAADYHDWHQDRSMRVMAQWLAEQDVAAELIAEVGALVRVHEDGGWPEAELLQAADSLSFLEVQVELFAARVRAGELLRTQAEAKFHFMYDRLRDPRARELARPLLAGGLALLAPDNPEPFTDDHQEEKQMLAYVLQSFDSAPQTLQVPQPEIGDGELLVRVHAVSVNPVDLAIAGGDAREWLEYRFPVTIGRDLAGVVERVGDGVSSFAPGDRVFGYIARDYAHDGSFAQYVAIPEGEFVVPTPAGVDDLHAAALGLAAVTATMCLDAAGVGEGSSVLVNGATGGVGGYAVQIAKARGAKLVVASGRPGDEEAHVRSLGADAVVDWSSTGFAQLARAAAPDSGFDALIDVVTGDPEAFATLATAVLADGGRAATTIGAADPERLGSIEATNVWSAPEPARLRYVAELAGAGRLTAPVGAVYGFDELTQAFEAVRRGALGKVCVRMVDNSK